MRKPAWTCSIRSVKWRDTPRFLRIAGDQISARGLADAVSDVTGERFKLLRAGGLGRLRRIIRVARTLFPARDALYPPWQGMQYLENMFSGRTKLLPIDNGRYPGIHWTSVQDFLRKQGEGKE